jgi:RNA polymerase sigma factor FliA
MKETWEAYKRTGKLVYRDELILAYQNLVKMTANKMAQSFPNSVETEDLMSYGLFGLIDAIEKFDPDLGYKFETYAVSRIRGAIIDEMRSLDWVPRSVRAHDKESGKTSGTMIALDEPMSSEEGTATYGDSIYEDDWDRDMVDTVARQMADATEAISEREHLVLSLYYYNGFTLAEIGTILGVTESRVCQIHTKTISKLRENYAM